ncbi:B12-binding domain-containing radical SAM protein [Candidatus Omnitrophota bacterium]
MGPLPTYGNNESLLDGSAQRFTKGQGIFTETSHTHHLGMHIIAQNLLIPCTVLETPTEQAFIKELKQGYTHVALQCFALLTDKVIKMAKIVKQVSPQTKVIVGCYGIACIKDAISKDSSLEKYFDYLCEGEGIEFCKKLFAEDIAAPIKQYLPLVSSGIPWLDYYKPGNCSAILSGLGCTNMCEFCYTSHVFKGRYIEIYDAEQIFQTMKMIIRDNPDLDSFIIYDEDFLKHKDKAKRLGRLIRQDDEFGLKKINYYCFASNSSTSQYDFEELVLMGVQTLFLGVESFYPNALACKNISTKRNGNDIRDTVKQLHNHGIYTLGAIIFGFDHHNRDNIQAEKKAFIELEPNLYQVNLFAAGPGTTLWERLKKEGRVYEDSSYKEIHSYGTHLRHPNFERYELLDFVEKMYSEIYEFGGPKALRILNVSLNGYQFCKKSKNPLLNRDKLWYHEDVCKKVAVMIKAIRALAPNKLVAEKADNVFSRYKELFGDLTMEQKVASEYIYIQAQRASEHRIKFPNRIPRKEAFRRYIYNNATRRQLEQGHRPYKVSYPDYSKHYRKCMTIRNYNRKVLARLPAQNSKSNAKEAQIIGSYLRKMKNSNLEKF